ncbi:penicillin-binding protein 1A [Paenibacillus crassostreae]|uniref:Carboxypeptidase n=1 Tax=Paenibacillus crassostreae TaxID=1763538 RepID=A0A167C795_9BACL|nr:penicillin-binding protein 1A [Paenibacillus crassostreae]AOZ91557.1 carboxypeptidase [Paenibacillus crassostreae]OAB72869.1 carboxypeptidase [Paenibacillus crassostreae]
MDDTNKKTSKEELPPKKSIGRVLGLTLLWLIVIGFMGALFVGGAGIGYVSSIVHDEPVRTRTEIEQKMSQNSITGFAYFSDGTPIGQLRTEEDRRPVDFEKIPNIVKDAVIAIEDNDFSTHNGIDISGTLRAVKQRVLNESIQTGGSTLTQQLARRVFLNLDRTDNRKIKEMLLSLRLERYLTKEQILAAYLNKVPFGNGANGYNVYGIKAAAKGIFNISDLEQLNIAQAAYLAGLPQLPSTYSAFNGKGEFNPTAFGRAMDRQKLVLRRMLEEGKISNGEYNEASVFDIQASLAQQTEKAYSTFPYLMMETERKAAEILLEINAATTEDTEQTEKNNSELLEEATLQLTTGGYRVYTTINKTVYNTMHQIAENDDNFSADSKTKGKEQTAAMLMDNKTGAILGMIEGRDFYEEQMNYATQMVRQPGSAMKPIAAYLPALDSGAIQPASIVDDAPIILKDGQKGFHIPKNSSRGYEGLVTARYALNMSKNTIALKLFNNVITIDKAWEFAKQLGITSIQEADYAASTGVLGGLKYGVSVEELTNAYSSIANQGEFLDAYMIEKITDANGNIVYKHTPDPVKVFSEQTAYLMTDMLRTVITQGTGSTVKNNYNHWKEVPIVGKTGSTQNYADVWFMGYSPDVTLGVWVGYKEPVNVLEGNQRKNAQSLWALIMNEMIDKKPDLFVTSSFEKPSGITNKTVSAYSGKLPSSLTDKYVTDLFNTKYVPSESDDGIEKAKYLTYNGVNYIPQETTPDDMLKEKIVIKREYPIQDLIKDLQEAFTIMKDHESLGFYLPKDASSDMPTEIDPRVDDGGAPTPPGNVSISYVDGTAQINFSQSASKDVVGYRLYRSLSGSEFQHQGNVIIGDAPLVFTYNNATKYAYNFYIKAVDVAGNESGASAVVGNSGTQDTEQGDEIISNPDQVLEPGQTDQGTPIDDFLIPPVGEGALTIPSAPGQPVITSTDSGIQINWSANNTDTIISFVAYYSKDQSGTFSQVGSSQATSIDLSNPITGWYRITAVNSAGESLPSAASYFEKK